MIIDAHLHLWNKQQGRVKGKPVIATSGGKSDFGGDERQMMPPYMIDGANTVEMLISNMNYARVSAAVVTQEYIDGNQDDYLIKSRAKYPSRLKICSLYEENKDYKINDFDGIKICAGRLKELDLRKHIDVFDNANKLGKFISIDMADGGLQVKSLQEIIIKYPDLKIAIGHFGMVTRTNWQSQIKLAQNKNVYIETGGITWLFHHEFYPYDGAIDAIKEAVQICGIEKLMWGSDYPRTMSEITYKMSYDFICKTDKLSKHEKDLLLGGNAKDFYDFRELVVPTYIKNMLED